MSENRAERSGPLATPSQAKRRHTVIQRVLVVLGLLALVVAALGVTMSWGSGGPSHSRVLPPPEAGKSEAIDPPKATPQHVSEHSAAGGSVLNLSGASSRRAFATPTALQIPAIGVQTTVVPLGLNPDGSAAVPSGTTFTGWYDLGPTPGEIGPAVIIGHVDSYTGPGVFFNLKELLPGDTIMVDDGAVPVSFRVRQVVTYAKNTFPTKAVFGPTPDPELRLITCGGPFDRAIGHYEDNVVVYATST